MLPAIILHGSFDFSLFAMGSISFLYSDYDLVVTIVGIIIVGSMTVGGAVYAYKSYKKVSHLIILYYVHAIIYNCNVCKFFVRGYVYSFNIIYD